MTIAKITAQEWSTLLEQAALPRKQEGLPPIKRYLAIARPTDGKPLTEYPIEVVTSEQLKSGEYIKLKLEDISALSQKILGKNQDTTPTETQVAIAERIHRISQAKSQRLHEAKISRGALRVLSYILFATILGAAWGWLIKVELDRPEDKIKMANQFIAHLREANNDIEKAFAREEAYFQTIDEQIRFENNPANYEEDIAEPLKDILLEMFEKPDEEILYGFRVDQERNVFHIILKDGTTHDAQRAEKPSPCELNKFVMHQLDKVKEIVGEDDQKWRTILLLALGQQTFTRLVGNLIGSTGTTDFLQNPGEKYYYQLRPITPMQIQVTVVRDDAKKIKTLQVEAKISTASFYVETSAVDKAEPVPRTAIQSILKFDISLDTDKKPIILARQHHHEMG